MLLVSDGHSATQKASTLMPESGLYHEEQCILAAFAQPHDTSSALWRQESRALRQAIAPFARRVRLELLHGCTPEQLEQSVLRLEPSIVHVQAQSNTQGLLIEDDSNALHQLGWAKLQEIFVACPKLRCVILNGCDIQNTMALETSPFTLITTPGTIISEATLTFTFGFYDALAMGASISSCYGSGCEHMRRQGYAEHDLPQIREGYSSSQ